MNVHRTKLGWHNLHPAKLVLFALLSVADLFMTWQLVQATDGKVYESNPVANAWLTSFGWAGLTVFKALAMLLVALTAAYVSIYRPRAGGGILTFACTATAFVVLYSCYLAFHAEGTTWAASEDAFVAEQHGRLLDREMLRQKEYANLLARLSDELLAHRLTLRQAVAQLAQSQKARNPQWLAVLHRTYPGRSDEECLAIHLINHALCHVPRDPMARTRIANQLESEYQATYGSEVILDLMVQAHNGNPSASPPVVATGRTETPMTTVFAHRGE
jgi:hypothetical protein